MMLSYYQFEEPPTELNRQYNYNDKIGYDKTKGYGKDIVKGPDGNRLTLHPNAGVYLCLSRFGDAAASLTDNGKNFRTQSAVEAWIEFLHRRPVQPLLMALRSEPSTLNSALPNYPSPPTTLHSTARLPKKTHVRISLIYILHPF